MKIMTVLNFFKKKEKKVDEKEEFEFFFYVVKSNENNKGFCENYQKFYVFILINNRFYRCKML